MPKYCRAPNCSNAAGQARPPARRLSFYKFPLHDTARLRQWLMQMRRENWVPTRHQHLCSDHFEPSCFQYRWGVRYLRPDAVPTIFPRSPPKQESPSTLPGATQPKQPLPASSQEPVIPGQPAIPETTPSEAITIALEPDSAAATPLLGPVDSPEGVPAHPQPSLGYATAPPPPLSLCRRVEHVEDVNIELPIASPPPAHFEPIPATPVTVPETVLSSALMLPIVSTVPIVSKTVTSMSPPGELSTEELVGVVLVLQRKVKVLQQRQRRHRARLEAMEGLVEQLRRESLLSEERLKLACLQPGPVTADPTSAVTIICQEEEEEEEATLVYTVPPPAGTTCGLSLEQL